MENKLGLLFSGNYQRVNRSNEFLSSNYEFLGNNPNSGEPIIEVSTLNLGDRLEDRVRYGGSLTADYAFNRDHSLLYNGNLGQLNRDDQQFRRRYRISDNEQRFTARERERSTFLQTHSLSGEHRIKQFSAEWRGSYSSSRQETSRSLRSQFWELAATDGIAENNSLNAVPAIFKNNLNNTTLRDVRFQTGLVNEDRITANLDLQYDISFGKKINGYLKTGAKYRQVDRSRDNSEVFHAPVSRWRRKPRKIESRTVRDQSRESDTAWQLPRQLHQSRFLLRHL